MNISVTEEALNQLEHLQRQTKFTEEDFYPGAPTEDIRVACERRVNDFLRDAIHALRNGVEREELFERARALQRSFNEEDTEEAEKVGDYIGETMCTLGIEDWADHV
jgi:Domain of unknown function (DUF4844)